MALHVATVAAAAPPLALLSIAKRTTMNVLERGGGLEVIRWFSRHTPRILVFHRFGLNDTPRTVSELTFERQIAFLKARFRIVPLDEIVALRSAGGSMPPNLVAITVDDGYEDFYRHAYPVLRWHRVPATLFVVSRFAAGTLWLWPDLIQYAVEHTDRRDFTLDLGPKQGRWLLASQEDRFAAWSDIADHCLTLGPDGTREVTTALLHALGVELPASPPPELRASSWDQLREMAAGGIDIGSHTRTHPRLSLLGQEDLHDEIDGSKREIEAQLSRPVVSFAYPHGGPRDFDDRCRRELAASGYSCAVAGYYAANVLGDPYALKRLSADRNWDDFLKAVYGVKHLTHVVGIRAIAEF